MSLVKVEAKRAMAVAPCVWSISVDLFPVNFLRSTAFVRSLLRTPTTNKATRCLIHLHCMPRGSYPTPTIWDSWSGRAHHPTGMIGRGQENRDYKNTTVFKLDNIYDSQRPVTYHEYPLSPGNTEALGIPIVDREQAE